MCESRGGEIGIHEGLKIPWTVMSVSVRARPAVQRGEERRMNALKYLDGMFNLIENRMHRTAHTNATASLKIATMVVTLEEPWR